MPCHVEINFMNDREISLTICRAAAVLALLLGVPDVRAADDEGIRVSGVGQVLAKPNRLEIDVVAAGAAELTGDALVKYRESLKRTIDAFDQLKLKNLKVEQ